jgi:HTH-type transcriptional regulator / antitoxin HigA
MEGEIMIAKPRIFATRHAPRDDYLALIQVFPLRPIRTEAQHAKAMKIAGHLATFAEGTLSAGEQDYLDALTVLLEDHDRRQEPWGEISGRELLRHLVEEAGMKVADLGKVVGSPSLASLILSGKRDISRDVMKRLGAHFHVDPGAFL